MELKTFSKFDEVKTFERYKKKALGIGLVAVRNNLRVLTIEVVDKEIITFSKILLKCLEIEIANCNAKKFPDKSEDYYEVKHSLINELIILAKEENLYYGYHLSDVSMTNKIVYFDIPKVGQLSWHLETNEKLPFYEKQWDKTQNSTFKKLFKVIKKLFKEYGIEQN